MVTPTPAKPHRRPESVLVVVYARGGEVLLLHRHRPFEFWQSITGSLLPGESHDAAAVRELGEETGFEDNGTLTYTGVSRVFVIDPRWRHRYPPGVYENVEYEWRFRLDAPNDVRLSPSEHSAFCWLPLQEAIDRVWSWTNREALEDLARDLA
ncbi:MAG: dihydroneopterin triphosphate diphosphatase [Gammaproteobacteria bacterium]